MKTIEFELSKPITYQNNGFHEETKKLLMTAPSVQMLGFSAPLKQGFFNQVLKLNKSQPASNDKNDSSLENKMTSQSVLMILYMGDLDIIKYMNDFKTLCTKGAVKLPNGESVTNHILESLESEDFENLMGEYISNFIVGSLLLTTKVS